MPDNISPIDSPRKSGAAQAIDSARKPVPTMPLILDRMAYKFERGVLIDSIRREFECPPAFVEAVIRRRIRQLSAEIAELRREVRRVAA